MLRKNPAMGCAYCSKKQCCDIRPCPWVSSRPLAILTNFNSGRNIKDHSERCHAFSCFMSFHGKLLYIIACAAGPPGVYGRNFAIKLKVLCATMLKDKKMETIITQTSRTFLQHHET